MSKTIPLSSLKFDAFSYQHFSIYEEPKPCLLHIRRNPGVDFPGQLGEAVRETMRALTLEQVNDLVTTLTGHIAILTTEDESAEDGEKKYVPTALVILASEIVQVLDQLKFSHLRHSDYIQIYRGAEQIDRLAKLHMRLSPKITPVQNFLIHGHCEAFLFKIMGACHELVRSSLLKKSEGDAYSTNLEAILGLIWHGLLKGDSWFEENMSPDRVGAFKAALQELARVYEGHADLEGVLLHEGEMIPNLQAQRRSLFMKTLEIAQVSFPGNSLEILESLTTYGVELFIRECHYSDFIQKGDLNAAIQRFANGDDQDWDMPKTAESDRAEFFKELREAASNPDIELGKECRLSSRDIQAFNSTGGQSSITSLVSSWTGPVLENLWYYLPKDPLATASTLWSSTSSWISSSPSLSKRELTIEEELKNELAENLQ